MRKKVKLNLVLFVVNKNNFKFIMCFDCDTLTLFDHILGFLSKFRAGLIVLHHVFEMLSKYNRWLAFHSGSKNE